MASFARLGPHRAPMHSSDGEGRKLRPTVKTTPGFSASADAEQIYYAMRGIGTDEDKLINILARRTNYERQEICAAYESQYKKSLRDAIKDDTSGQFKTILCELTHDVAYLYAKALYHAMKGLGTKERVLIEVLSSLRNKEMEAVVEAYEKVLEDHGLSDKKRSLITDLESDTSGDFFMGLKCLVDEKHDEITLAQLKNIQDSGIGAVCNVELAETDAKNLSIAGHDRLGTNEKRFMDIICRRTSFQLCMDVHKYKQLFNRDLLDDMKSELSGDFKDLLITIVRYVTDRSSLIAEWFNKAISGIGTDDYTLMRLLITRSEIDLEDIKEAYEMNYGRTLEVAISGDTSGDYKKTLLSLLRSI